MAKLACFLLMCIGILIMSVNLTDADCCEPYEHRCPDLMEGERCCGVGDCNYFCCGCEGGCRGSGWSYRKWKGKRDLTSKLLVQRGIQHIDQNGDNVVNKTEGYAYIKSGACGNVSRDFQEFEKHFNALDMDGDGALTHEEIDKTAK